MEKIEFSDYLRFNKIGTGIKGLDELLFKGLVIPDNNNMLILIRGNDNTEKTAMSLQLLHGIAQTFKKRYGTTTIHYHCNYLEKS